MSIEDRLAEMNITLPNAAAPAANYVPFVISGNYLYVSGQIPIGPNGIEYIGKLGENASIEDGQAAAKLCAINILAQAKSALGELERIIRLVKLVGFVNSTSDFVDQPKIINGASDFMVAALGDRGAHARSAVGVAALPFGVAVEVEAIFEI
ncbi:RidA family protein [Pararhizobium sp. IMCC21322]|uniref:RidA family protein n=1 Tax=Pararhizobium sp. IMCC21322 TaxID=3067903 RepID=UPI002741D0D2|nr:RidA family protein [Pararhizobium sp. IMCC21322]